MDFIEKSYTLYIAMSLDGYIADENGGVEWIEGDGSCADSDGSYSDFINTVDTVIMGYKTYRQIICERSPDKWVYNGLTTYVMTHRTLNNRDNIVFTNESMEKLISGLRNRQGGNIWICGGASIANQFIELELIDMICINMIPVLLGRGIRLFKRRIKKYDLKLISLKSYNGITDLMYEIKK